MLDLAGLLIAETFNVSSCWVVWSFLTRERNVVSAGDERILTATADHDTVVRVRVGDEHETLEIFKLPTTTNMAMYKYQGVNNHIGGSLPGAN